MTTVKLLLVTSILTGVWAVGFLGQFAVVGAPPSPFTIETVAGNGEAGGIPPSGGLALAVPLDQPFGVEAGPDGALYVTSIGQHRVLRLDLMAGTLASVAGNGSKGYSGDNGPAGAAQLNEPYEVRFDQAKNMYFVEMQNHLIRRVDGRTGTITTLAGTGTPGYDGDSRAAASAQFRQPHSIAIDDAGNIYVADIGNHRIRRIDARTGMIDSIAGNGRAELPRDGTRAQGQPILGPRALSIIGRTLWIALREGNSVWRMDLDTLVINHVAGTGQKGFSGDGGPAPLATFNGPKGIVATKEGHIFVVDSENQVVRLVETTSGRIYTVAGRGPNERGFLGERVPALQAKFDRPHGIGLAPGGGLYLGDTNNHRVRWLYP